MTNTILYFNGLQMHSRLDAKALATQETCTSTPEVQFKICDWQQPANGFMDEWVECAAGQIQHHPKTDTDRNLIVASSVGAWVAVMALCRIGAAAGRYVDEILLLSPDLNFTQSHKIKRWAQFEKGETVEIHCDSETPFIMTNQHAARGKPFTWRPNHCLELIAPSVKLSVIVPQEMNQMMRIFHSDWDQGPKNPLQVVENNNSANYLDLVRTAVAQFIHR